MDYKYKYYKYKSKYENQLVMQKGGYTKCKIEKDDIILYGDGGSTAIIVISKNKAYKIFLTFVTKDVKDDVSKQRLKRENKFTDDEINIYKELTKNIINKQISDHYVKYLSDHRCKTIKNLFNDCPKSYIEYLKTAKKKVNKICEKKFINHPMRKLTYNTRIVEIEYCPYSCKDFISDISKMPVIEMTLYLDIFFFQIIYTVIKTQEVYPYFLHADLFMRNILGLKEQDNGNYYTYHYKNKKYYIPSKKFFPKINDFGLTNLNKKFRNRKLIRSKYRDIYNILYDIYDGGNLGAKSLKHLYKDDPDKIMDIKKYFDNYFDTDILDNYKENHPNNINWDWKNSHDDNFIKSIKMKDPIDLLNNYFYKIFGKHNSQIKTFK